MRIVSVGGFTSYWGTDMAPNILELEVGKTVGGGEEAMIRTATELAARGHEVDLFWCGQPGKWRGVTFHSDRDPLSSWLLKNPPDVIIGWSTILPFQFVPKTTLKLFAQQLNDLWAQGDWASVDAIISPSRNHAQQLAGWGWRGAWTVVHNGLDPELYDETEVKSAVHDYPEMMTEQKSTTWVDGMMRRKYGESQPAWKDRPLNVGYWSSPDRGLQHLLKVWPDVVARVPAAKLHIFYEIDKWMGTGAARAIGAYGDRARLMLHTLLPRAKTDKSIVFHGAVSRKTLAKTQVNCRVQCYPYQPIMYCEGFGGAVNQGIAAGCHVLLTPHDAFETLYDGSVTWMPKDPSAMEAVLAENIVRALTDEQWSMERVALARPNRFKYTWEAAGNEMERAVNRQWDSAK